MKCPVIMAGQRASTENWLEESDDCLESDCAWFNKKQKDCAVLSIHIHLAELAWNLDEIRQRG